MKTELKFGPFPTAKEDHYLPRALAKAKPAKKNSADPAEALQLRRKLASAAKKSGSKQCVAITADGPGFMAAAYRFRCRDRAGTVSPCRID